MILPYLFLPLYFFLILVAPYLIIWGGLKILRITEISRSRIIGYVIIYVAIFFLIDQFKSLVGLNTQPKSLLSYFADNLIYLAANFLLLKYYFHLSGKKIWQFLLYLIITGLILSGLIAWII